jgi:hypothetical protein
MGKSILNISYEVALNCFELGLKLSPPVNTFTDDSLMRNPPHIGYLSKVIETI